MIACIQRVSRASVTVDGATVGSIGRGLVVLLCAEDGDTAAELNWMADKTTGLRIFENDLGKMSDSVEDIRGEILVISQFTLTGTLKKGRRPDFGRAMEPVNARAMYESFVKKLTERLGNDRVATGTFAAHMDVSLVNDGPVTILLERRPTEQDI